MVIKGLGASLDRGHAYVAGLHPDFDSTALVVLDLQSRSVVSVFGSETEVAGLAVSPVTGRAYLAGLARVTTVPRVTIMHEDANSEPSGNTPAGENVTVEPVDSNTGLALISITFSMVDAAGDTFAVVMSGATPQPPGYRHGTPPLWAQLSTTARYSGPVTICMPWREGQFEQESTIRVMRWEGGSWVDRTLSRDEGENRICARAESLEYSAFLVVEAGFQFSGFLAPVEPVPVRNVVKAGAAVPIRFSLGGYRGLDIFRDGAPISSQMQCDTLAPIAAFTATASAGQSGLSYDSQTDTYTYIWKTEKGWANSCRRFGITLTDGSSAQAYFSFTR